MTIKEIINQLMKPFKLNFSTNFSSILTKSLFHNFLLYILALIIIFFLYVISIDNINDKKLESLSNIKKSTETEQFLKLKEFIFSRLKNPYSQHSYTIQNNDSVQGILSKFNVDQKEINLVINKLKEKKLANIYSGRELKLILKIPEDSDNKNSLVSLYFPRSNTSFVEIKKSDELFEVKEQILDLKKKRSGFRRSNK